MTILNSRCSDASCVGLFARGLGPVGEETSQGSEPAQPTRGNRNRSKNIVRGMCVLRGMILLRRQHTQDCLEAWQPEGNDFEIYNSLLRSASSDAYSPHHCENSPDLSSCCEASSQ